jgi:hypothetical protein
MTAQATTLLDQLRELPLAERTELEKQLHAMNEFEYLRWIEEEVRTGRMETYTEQESNARARLGLAAARASRKA